VVITIDKNFGVSGLDYIPGRTSVIKSGFFFLNCPFCSKKSVSAELKPLIIPPTLIKYYELTFIKKLWLYFDILLRNVNRVVIIGSSLRSEDILFINYLSFLKEKNSKLKKVVLINPDEKIKNRLEKLTSLRVEWYKYLKDFV